MKFRALPSIYPRKWFCRHYWPPPEIMFKSKRFGIFSSVISLYFTGTTLLLLIGGLAFDCNLTHAKKKTDYLVKSEGSQVAAFGIRIISIP